jgi:hypothetical protein
VRLADVLAAIDLLLIVDGFAAGAIASMALLLPGDFFAGLHDRAALWRRATGGLAAADIGVACRSAAARHGGVGREDEQ